LKPELGVHIASGEVPGVRKPVTRDDDDDDDINNHIRVKINK
jgi:hypothetical protein